MINRRHRIIVDTNLWISFLLTRDQPKLDAIIAHQNATLVFSQELIDEFIEVSQRPKFRKYFDLADVEQLLFRISQIAEFISVTSNITICRDSKDNFLLSLAFDGLATHLITGDKDLLVLEKFGTTKIVTITSYLSKEP